ncbi:MAG: SBBP repeat-containing protein, partial [Pseudomonadota bacterium]
MKKNLVLHAVAVFFPVLFWVLFLTAPGSAAPDKESRPHIYQEIDGKKTVPGTFRIRTPDGEPRPRTFSYSFEVASYDPAYPLIIDPTLSCSTYLGGASWDSGSGIALDASGNDYITGSTSSTKFPVLNTYQETYGGGDQDAFVAKLSDFSQPVAAYSYYIPYYKANPVDEYASLALRNSSATTPATVTVTAFESNGTPVPLAAGFTGFTIDPSGQWADVLPRPTIEGWV